MYQTIAEATVDDGDIQVKVKQKSQGGLSLVLSSDDMQRAVKDLRYPRPVRTNAQKQMFCGFIRGRAININCLGDNKDKKKAIKDVKREMSKKTVKVELKVFGIDRSKTHLAKILEDLETARPDIIKIKDVGKSGYNGFLSGKLPKKGEDKDDELTLVASFKKELQEDGKLPAIMAEFATVINKTLKPLGMSDFEVGECEIKD